MKPLDPDLESLLREWIEKAEADLEAPEQLAKSGVHNVFGVAPAILSPVGCPDWEEHGQDRQCYHRAPN
jgi:hypothetical protein